MAFVQALARHRDLLKQTFTKSFRTYSNPDHLTLGKKLKKNEVAEDKSVEIPVETDTKKLAAFVCGTNLMKESGENVAIRPDSEYPDWLWTLHLGGPRPLSELDPNTLEYWERVRELAMEENHHLRSLYRQNRDYK